MAEDTTGSVEATIRNISRRTRKKYSAEDKLRIVLEGLRGERTITDLCCREGIHQNQHYKWSKEFLEVGKQRLISDTNAKPITRKSKRWAARTNSSRPWWRS